MPGLTDPSIKAPDDVVAAPGKRVVKRYNVYRNNVTVSLIDALAAVYPAIQRITGVDFFRAMARFHVRATPPTSPLLFEYGRESVGTALFARSGLLDALKREGFFVEMERKYAKR